MRWSSQNLNDRRDGTVGSILRYGRGWLWFGNRACLGVEWSWFGSPSLGLEFRTGGEDDLQLSVSVLVARFYVTLSGFFAYDRFDRSWPKETGVRLWKSDSDFYLTLVWRCQNHMWPPDVGWGCTKNLTDMLLGRAEYSTYVLSKTESRVPMPEKNYPCTVTMSRAEWKRPRWPLVRRVLRGEVEVPDGIPVPGKGTTDYNCGPDAIYSHMSPSRDAHEAIGQLVESALRQRKQYPL